MLMDWPTVLQQKRDSVWVSLSSSQVQRREEIIGLSKVYVGLDTHTKMYGTLSQPCQERELICELKSSKAFLLARAHTSECAGHLVCQVQRRAEIVVLCNIAARLNTNTIMHQTLSQPGAAAWTDRWIWHGGWLSIIGSTGFQCMYTLQTFNQKIVITSYDTNNATCVSELLLLSPVFARAAAAHKVGLSWQRIDEFKTSQCAKCREISFEASFAICISCHMSPSIFCTLRRQVLSLILLDWHQAEASAYRMGVSSAPTSPPPDCGNILIGYCSEKVPMSGWHAGQTWCMWQSPCLLVHLACNRNAEWEGLLQTNALMMTTCITHLVSQKRPAHPAITHSSSNMQSSSLGRYPFVRRKTIRDHTHNIGSVVLPGSLEKAVDSPVFLAVRIHFFSCFFWGPSSSVARLDCAVSISP